MRSSINDKNTIIDKTFLWLLLFAFIILKVCGVIDWSWWWVFSPIWIPLGIFVICLPILFVCNFFIHIKERWENYGEERRN